MKTPTTTANVTTVIAACLTLANIALAQSVPTAPLKPASTDAILLTPFEVSSEKDNGYAATETLAGTRMRTNLRDVGASLSILTPEFLRDLGVNSFDQALLYTPSVDATEGDNTDANRASGTQMRYGTGQSYSIRGFNTNAGNQSISHDFFNALEPTDNYNLERITLSLGPNALLIGVGNPQGTAVTTTKRAELKRRKTEVQTQADTNGSRRIAIDHNQPLIKDKLGFRLNLLHDQAREFRRYEGKNQERLTLSVTAKPLPNTKLTLNHENYSLGTNASSLVWGFDGSVLRWAASGKPTIEFLPAGQQWTATRPYVDAKGNSIPVANGVVDTDGLVASRNDFDPKLVLGQSNGNQPTWIVGLPLANPMVNTRYQGTLGGATFGGQGSANYQSKDPWTALGLSKSTNLNGGTWDDPSNKQHGRWSQLLLEQKLAEGLFLELGGNLALYNQTLDPNNFTNVTIDPNRYLPDGSNNPGYLVPYSQIGGQGEQGPGEYNADRVGRAKDQMPGRAIERTMDRADIGASNDCGHRNSDQQGERDGLRDSESRDRESGQQVGPKSLATIVWSRAPQWRNQIGPDFRADTRDPPLRQFGQIAEFIHLRRLKEASHSEALSSCTVWPPRDMDEFSQ